MKFIPAGSSVDRTISIRTYSHYIMLKLRLATAENGGKHLQHEVKKTEEGFGKSVRNILG